MDESSSAHRQDEHHASPRPAEQRRKEQRPSAPVPAEAGPGFHSDVDDASESSFPASDPPAWMGLRPGGPLPPDGVRNSNPR